LTPFSPPHHFLFLLCLSKDFNFFFRALFFARAVLAPLLFARSPPPFGRPVSPDVGYLFSSFPLPFLFFCSLFPPSPLVSKVLFLILSRQVFVRSFFCSPSQSFGKSFLFFYCRWPPHPWLRESILFSPWSPKGFAAAPPLVVRTCCFFWVEILSLPLWDDPTFSTVLLSVPDFFSSSRLPHCGMGVSR